MFCRGTTPRLVVEAWSIEGKPALRFPIIRYDLPENEDNNTLSMSPDSTFIAAKEKLFRISPEGVLTPLPFTIESGNETGLRFDHQSPRFADVQEQDGIVTIKIYEIEADETLHCILSHEIVMEEEDLTPREVKVSFARTQKLMFAYTYWTEFMINKTCLVTVEDDEVTLVDICDGKYPLLNELL